MTRTLAATLASILAFLIPLAAQDAARIPAGSTGTVTLSRSDYDRLLDLAARRPSGLDPSPTAAAVTRAKCFVPEW
jgi:hypothetical protein